MFGIAIDALKMIQEIFNFKVHYVFTNTYGHVSPNGTLLGTKGNVIAVVYLLNEYIM